MTKQESQSFIDELDKLLEKQIQFISYIRTDLIPNKKWNDAATGFEEIMESAACLKLGLLTIAEIDKKSTE